MLARRYDYDRSYYVALTRRLAREHRVNVDDVLGRSRKREHAHVRHLVWCALREQDPQWSYPRIAAAARTHHTTVLSAVHAKRTKEA